MLFVLAMRRISNGRVLKIYRNRRRMLPYEEKVQVPSFPGSFVSVGG